MENRPGQGRFATRSAFGPRRAVVVLLVGAVIGAARPALADCTATMRPATAEEKKAYADAFALFLRVAPPAPAGWAHRDSASNGMLEGPVCANPGERILQWSFSRAFSRVEGADERNAEAARQVLATAEQGAALKKSNEAKLAEVRKKMDALTAKLPALAAAQNFAEMQKVSEEMEKLTQQQMALMGVEQQDAAFEKIEAAASKDTDADFSLTTGAPGPDMHAFKPMAVPVGKGYRQDFASKGNPRVNMVVVLPPAAGAGQVVVRINGDPERAQGLLNATKLR